MDLDLVVQCYHQAADAFARGDPEPVQALFSHGDDVTLANPFGPPVRGWDLVRAALDHASSRFRDGRVTGFEPVARYRAADLATILEIETWEAKVGGSDDLAPFTLRVTSTFRWETDGWKIVHRHADPIATYDPAGPLRAT